jgi:hypothetical protein
MRGVQKKPLGRVPNQAAQLQFGFLRFIRQDCIHINDEHAITQGQELEILIGSAACCAQVTTNSVTLNPHSAAVRGIVFFCSGVTRASMRTSFS